MLVVIKYDSVEDAIRMANDTIYGLAAGVWSRDVERAVSVAERIQAGTIWINDYHIISAEAPFGGFKQSGIGRAGHVWSKEYTVPNTFTCRSTTGCESKFYYRHRGATV